MPAKSSGSPHRRIGTRLITRSSNTSSPTRAAVIAVLIQPGMIVFDVMPWRAISTARPRDIASSAPFVEA